MSRSEGVLDHRIGVDTIFVGHVPGWNIGLVVILRVQLRGNQVNALGRRVL